MKNKTRHSPIEEFIALPDAEKNRIAAEFDRENVIDTFKPLSPAQRRQWAKAKRKRGRPVVGQGSRIVSLSMELGLLQKADALAKREGLTRAQLVARGLRLLIAAA